MFKCWDHMVGGQIIIRASSAARTMPPARSEPVVVCLVDSDEDDGTAVANGDARQGSRRSRRLSESQVKPDHAVMLTFHADESDSRTAISITWGDFRRLRLPDGRTGEEQLLLNDTLVDWYLKYLESRRLGADTQKGRGLRERTHIFSSFFLKRLRGALQQKDAGRRNEQMAALLKWVRVRRSRASQRKSLSEGGDTGCRGGGGRGWGGGAQTVARYPASTPAPHRKVGWAGGLGGGLPAW